MSARTPIGADIDLLCEAVHFVLRTQFAAQSSIQRNIRVGFVKAQHLLNLMEERGIVGPAHGTFARDVLILPGDTDAVCAELRAEVTP